MMSPLISISMPCFDARATLPKALASLQVQTCPDWELLLVNDGSRDNPAAVARVLDDPRIRYFRFEENRGRGAARQLTLDKARGKYFAMLDADDWMFPSRLERQFDVLENTPELSLLSAGMAIVDSRGKLSGVRRLDAVTAYPAVHSPLDRLGSLPVAHAPSMVRIEAALEAGYDRSFRSFEDKEFLLRVLLSGGFAVLPRLLYAYHQSERLDLATTLASYRSAAAVYRRYRSRFLGSYLGLRASLWAKGLAWRVVSLSRQDRYLERIRSKAPTPPEREAYEAARKTVESATAELEGALQSLVPSEA